MPENQYFSRVMDAVDLIAGENLRKKRLNEQRDYNLKMLENQQSFQREMADQSAKNRYNVQMLRNIGDLEEINRKNEIATESLVALPPEIEKDYPALAGFGKIWKPSEVSIIADRVQKNKGLSSYRSGMLSEKQKDLKERTRHDKAMENKNSITGSVGSKDPTKRLESLRKEAIELLKSGYYGDYTKESVDKSRVTGYVDRADALLNKLRSGEDLTAKERKEINDFESFLVYSQKKDSRDKKGIEAVGRLTDILNRLEKEIK